MKKILFVCRENAKRSQLAEAIANNQFQNVTAISAGTHPAEKVDQTAVAFIKTIDPKVKRYYPKSLMTIMGHFDAVITLGCEVDRKLLPKARVVQDWPVSDPESVDDFERVESFLKERISMLVEQLN